MIFIIGWLMVGICTGLALCYFHDEKEDSAALGEAMIACLAAWPVVVLAGAMHVLAELIKKIISK